MSELLEQLGIRDRASVETFIERLIDMLDAADGDADLEPYLAGARGTRDDREDESDFEPEETDQNGDEQDYGACEDDALAGQLYCLSLGPIPGGQGL